MRRSDHVQRERRRIRIERSGALSPVSPVSILLIATLFSALFLLGGCQTDDCVNCVELPAPVVPTGVHSISYDDLIVVQWYDISYAPYDGEYNENVVSYLIYSRYYEPGDEYDPDREFYLIGEVAWNDPNWDPNTGLHKFYDYDARNGDEYEYAVAAKNAAGRESALSYELVTDAPLPMSATPLTLHDYNGDNSHLSGFDFSALEQGRVDPDAQGTTADILIQFTDGIPYVETVRPLEVLIQDFGVFSDGGGDIYFEGVDWAPDGGYSNTGLLELVVGHVYVLKIGHGTATVNYAKFGVVATSAPTVQIIWAYQTITGLPELAVPDEAGENKPGQLVYEF